MAHFHAQAGAEVPPASLRPGFVLAMGPDSNLDLVAGRPSLSDLGIELPRGAGTLVRADAVPRIALAAGPAAAAIVVEGGPEAHFLPFTAAFSTRNWFYGAAGAPPLTGLQQFSNIVRHAREAFVLTLGGQRTVFTRHGVVHGAVDPAAPPPYPEGVVRRGDQFFVAEAVVDAAPVLAGPHVLLPPGGEHPIMRAVLPLVLLAPHLPPRTALMGPAPAADLLGLFGFAKLRRVPAAVSLCGAETLFWSEAGEQLSADVARAARDRAHAVQPPPLERRRIFVTAGLGNAAWLSEMTTALGFETVHAMPADAVERARLFASARSLIAVSGLALENVLFCLPGTQIVELSPDVAWDGRYAVLSDQLGLLHAVQPCAVADGALVADGSVLRLLLRLLQARP
jgi:hypothetical protein